MSDDIWKALIGAAAALGVAFVNKINFEKKNSGGKEMKIRSFTLTKVFVWVIAPIAGATTAFLISQGASAIAGPGSVPMKSPVCIRGYFFPSGFMGDGQEDSKAIKINQWTENCHPGPTCIQIVYHPAKKGWAGVYWQSPDGNWGDKEGRKIEGTKKLVFSARGQRGGELVDFKAGGINDPDKKYRDSFEKILGTQKLTTEWQQFEIDLSGANTNSVLGAFAWTATKDANPDGLAFYLDDICFK
jgi:hypothetical protein